MGNKTIRFNPNDIVGMRELMKKYGDSETMFFRENEAGESITISIFRDKIIVTTCQDNGRDRKNIYHWDGTREELFETTK